MVQVLKIHVMINLTRSQAMLKYKFILKKIYMVQNKIMITHAPVK